MTATQPHQAISHMDKVSSGVYKILGTVQCYLQVYDLNTSLSLLEDNGMAKTTLVPAFPELLTGCKQLVNQVEKLAGSCQVLRVDKLQQTAQL